MNKKAHAPSRALHLLICAALCCALSPASAQVIQGGGNPPGQLAQYRAAAQAYRDAAAQCPGRRACYLAYAAYHDCLGDALNSGAGVRCTVPNCNLTSPTCDGSSSELTPAARPGAAGVSSLGSTAGINELNNAILATGNAIGEAMLRRSEEKRERAVAEGRRLARTRNPADYQFSGATGTPVFKSYALADARVTIGFGHVPHFKTSAFIVPLAHVKSSGWSHIPDDWCHGHLYVMSGRVAYVPLDDQRQDHAFDIYTQHLEAIKISEYKVKGQRLGLIQIKGPGVNGSDFYLRGNEDTNLRSDLAELNNFVVRAVTDFDSAVREMGGEAGGAAAVVDAMTRGVALYDERKYAEAESLFRQVARASPGVSLAHAWLGYAVLEQNRPAEAEAAIREAIRLNPLSAGHRVSLAGLFGRLNRLADAEAEYRTAILLGPDDHVVFYSLGEFYYAQKRYADAEPPLRRAVALVPNAALYHGALGRALREGGQLAAAEPEFKEAIRMAPKNGLYRAGLAKLYAYQQKWSQAESEARAGVRLSPEVADAHYILGLALAGRNKTAEAEAEYREAIRLAPTNAAYKEALARLQGARQ